VTSPITRAQIPSVTIGQDPIMVSGYQTAGDGGSGAIYTKTGASSTGPAAIQDASGSWLNLVIDSDDIRLADFGVLADNATDNAAALMNMRLALIGTNKPHWRIHAPAGGTIIYSNNRWLYGISRFDLYGNGSTFRSIFTVANQFNLRAAAFFCAFIYQNNVLSYVGSITWNPNYLFNTAVAGGQTITLTTTSQYTNFFVGQRIFLQGYDTQGWVNPLGPRYKEWNVVTAVNSGTGVLTLLKPLRYNYSTSWWDVPYSPIATGLPRITCLDGTAGPSGSATWSGYSIYAGFHDLTWGMPCNSSGVLTDETSNIGSIETEFPAQTWVLDHVKCEPLSGFSPAENELVLANDCIFDYGEIDQRGGILEFTRCIFTNQCLVNGTNWEKILLLDCIAHKPLWMSPRNLEIIGGVYTADASINPALYDATVHSGDQRIKLDHLTLINPSGGTSPALLNVGALDASLIVTLTAANIPGSGTDMIFPWNKWDDDAANYPAQRMEAGITRFSKNDGTKGGVVTNIVWDATILAGSPTAYSVSSIAYVTGTGVITLTMSAAPAFGASGAWAVYGLNLTLGNVTGITGGTLNATWPVTNIVGAVVTLQGTTGFGGTAVGGNVMGGFRVSGNWNAVPVAAEVWTYFTVSEIIDSGDHIILNQGAPNVQQIYADTMRWAGNQSGRGKIHTMTISNRDVSWSAGANPINFYGSILDIDVNVMKVASAACNLQIQNETNTLIMKIDLATLGRRYLSKFLAQGSVGVDTILTSNFIGWCKQIYWLMSSNPTSLPEFTVQLRWTEI
jgi:hypothetical protein